LIEGVDVSEPWGPHLRFRGPAVGSIMALSAGLVWSFGAVTARLADGSDAFQYLLWRSAGIIVVVEGWRLVRRLPSHTVTAFTSGRRMLAANVCLLLASIGFIYAVKTTSAATAAFLGSTTPLFGVLTSRVFLGERANWRTMSAIALAFAGLYIMVSHNIDAGNVYGNLAAIASAVGFAAYTTVVRSAPDRDWAPVMPGYGVLMILICSIVIASNDTAFVPPVADIGWAVLHGGLFIVAGTTLYNGASKNVPASAMTVFAQSEMVLVPVWAFLVLAERPSNPTIVGGTIIFVAVIGKAWLDHRYERTRAGVVSEVASV
jgi:drug/metabolite transporter, DME family